MDRLTTGRSVGRLDRRGFLTIAATAAIGGIAGCLDSSGAAGDEGEGDADGWITDWNERYVAAVQSARDGNFQPTRRAAMMNVAIFDAVNAITAARGQPHYEPYLSDLDDPPEDASRSAAGAAAAHRILTNVYSAEFQDLLDSSMEKASSREGDVDAGAEWGRTVADRVLTLREEDGDYSSQLYVACPDEPNAPGCFRSSWSAVQARIDPWTMSSPDQFRAGEPPELDSEAYAEAWHEVYEKGADTEDRPQSHVDQAAFWRGAAGSPRPPNMWNVIAQKIARAEGTGILETARLFAILSLANADAGVATAEAKAYYGAWRPASAINDGDRDGNPDTYADPSWSPISVGSSPEYPAGLACFAGVGRRVLVEFFGDDHAFEFGENLNTGFDGDDYGVTRSFESFSEAHDDSCDSRIYLGNHFRFALEAGSETGDELAGWVLDNHLQPVE